MSTKFNRGNINAADDQFYHDDYKDDVDGLEEDLRTVTTDMNDCPCILSGLAVSINVNLTSVNVSAGVGYDNEGYRVNVAISETGFAVDTTLNAVNFVCISHVYTDSDSRNAYKTGVLYNTRRSDDYVVSIKLEADGPADVLEEAGYIVLAKTTGTGTTILLSTAERTTPDFSGNRDTDAPPQVIGLALTTGDEPSLIYNGSGNPIMAQMISHGEIARAWIKVAWIPVSDISGIKEYEVEVIPLDSSDAELPDYLQSETVSYNYV
jgi:hypothetical protein